MIQLRCVVDFYSHRRKDYRSLDNSSKSSSISTATIQRIIEDLKQKRNRASTNKMYYGVWKQFNEFFIRLDKKPSTWEDRLILFVGYLVEMKKVSTVKSYISGIKSVLMNDGIEISENRYLITSLTKACKYVNCTVRTRLPIQKGLLHLLMDSIDELYGSEGNNQPFLNILYKTLFTTAYYGLFRIGEVAKGSHPVLARDVHVGDNKDKMLFIQRTSKTHWLDSKPQLIKITGYSSGRSNINYCPFTMLRNYLEMRGKYNSNTEPFFVFRNKKPGTPGILRSVLASGLKKCNVNHKLYSFHSFRIGRSVDLLKAHVEISEIRKIGRWKSNTVY